MRNLQDELYLFGIVPVISIDHIEDAKPLAKALCKGGLAVAEVTYRTECAHDAIAIMRTECPDMLVGAGTVLTIEQVDSAIDAGAQFIVSPGLNPKIVKYCQEKKILIIPGCANPSDIEVALELGLTTVKFFPAEANGGIASIKAMSAPYGNLSFMPTGGVNEANLNDYLRFDKIIACGGTWMASKDLITNKRFDDIEDLTRKAIVKMLNIRFAHFGLNTEDSTKNVASVLSNFTKQAIEDKKASTFVGDIELMKEPKRGKLGHIGYYTSNVERAKFYLEKDGFTFDLESATYDKQGKLTFIYTLEEVNGYAIHLMKEKI